MELASGNGLRRSGRPLPARLIHDAKVENQIGTRIDPQLSYPCYEHLVKRTCSITLKVESNKLVAEFFKEHG